MTTSLTGKRRLGAIATTKTEAQNETQPYSVLQARDGQIYGRQRLKVALLKKAKAPDLYGPWAEFVTKKIE
jgi:hypothetical protein